MSTPDAAPTRDHVYSLLERELRGRDSVTQPELARVCRYSKATVSRRLGDLEDQGVITRRLLGGVNVVWWRGEEPEGVDV